MKIEYELIKPDYGSSFRVLHQKVMQESEFIWQYHYHPEYELVYIPDGNNGTRHIGAHVSSFSNGDLVLIGSNIPHSGFGLHSSGSHEEIVLQFKGEVMPQPIVEFRDIENLLERSKYGIAFSQQTKQMVGNKIMKMVRQNPLQRYLYLVEILHLLATAEGSILLNNRIISSRPVTKHRIRLQKILSYVENGYHKEILIREAASIAGLSVPSFCNFFKKATTITFSEFVKHYRIQKACHLLQQDKTVAEVCYDCGFNNVTYFNRLFKDLTKQTPSEFRKAIAPVSV